MLRDVEKKTRCLGVKEKVRGNWKNMYCVLRGGVLSMYKTEEDVQQGRMPQRTVPISMIKELKQGSKTAERRSI